MTTITEFAEELAAEMEAKAVDSLKFFDGAPLGSLARARYHGRAQAYKKASALIREKANEDR